MRYRAIRAVCCRYTSLLALPVILLALPGFDLLNSLDIARPVRPPSAIENRLKNTGKVFLTLKHYDFLIPAAYLNAYRVKFRPESQYRVGGFSLDVLLPGMEHITPANEAAFKALGFGRQLSVGIGERELSILERIENWASFDQQSIDLDKLIEPGLHSLPVWGEESREKRSRYLFNSVIHGRSYIKCSLPKAVQSPSCQFDWDYFPGLEFYTTYSFVYFPRHEEILGKLQRLLQTFIDDAAALKKAVVSGR